MGFLENKYGANTLYTPKNTKTTTSQPKNSLPSAESLMSNPYTAPKTQFGTTNLTLKPTDTTTIKLGGSENKTSESTTSEPSKAYSTKFAWLKRNRWFVIGGVAAVGLLTTAIVLLNKNK